MRKLLVLGVALAAVLPLSSARANAPVVTLKPDAIDAPVFTIHEFVATITTATGVPVANSPVTWLSGSSQIVVHDQRTDAAGHARAVVRGFSEGEDAVSAFAGTSAFSCDPEVDPCATAGITWTQSHARCAGSAFGLQVATVRTGDVDLPEENCEDGGGDTNSTLDTPLGSFAASTAVSDFNPEAEAKAADVTLDHPTVVVGDVVVPRLRIEAADAYAQSFCGGNAKAFQRLASSAIRITDLNDDSVIYDNKPMPNTPLAIPGLGTIILNEQTTTLDGSRASGSVNAVHAKFGPVDLIVSHAETSVSCVGFGYETVLGVGGDAHTDSSTGPVHLALEAYIDPAGGAPFKETPLQYTDGREDPASAPTVPFTCFNGDIRSIAVKTPLRGGHARVLVSGVIRCKNLVAGVTSDYSFDLVVEDISPFRAPDFYEMTIKEGATVRYTFSALTDDGALWIGDR